MGSEPIRLAPANATEPTYCEAFVSFAGSTGANRLAGDTSPTLHLLLELTEPGTDPERIEFVTTSPWGTTIDLAELTIANELQIEFPVLPLLEAVAKKASVEETLAATQFAISTD